MDAIFDAFHRVSPGDAVWYVSKNGDGVISPAVVLRTLATTVRPENIKEGPHAPGALPEGFKLDLDSDLHVDLLVHGLAKDYREYNVPWGDRDVPASWVWPPRI